MVSDSLAVECGGADFGDLRLTKRLETVVEELGARPVLSIPAAAKGRAEMEGAYRFFSNEKVTPERILQPHFDTTLDRVSQSDYVLFVQDTTEIDLTRPTQQVDGAGRLGGGPRKGAYLHPLLTFDINGVPLGMAWQMCWMRGELDKSIPKNVKNAMRRKLPIEEKESIRWIKGIQATREAAEACPNTTCVCVGDSESDIYELFSESRATSHSNLHLIVRACQTRLTTDNDNWLDKTRASDCLYTCTIHASKRSQDKVLPKAGKREQAREARTTTVEIRRKTVTLRPPARNPRKLPELQLNMVLVEEPNPPEGNEPVRWLLATTLPIDNEKQLRKIVTSYCVRWQIEIFFKTLKSGCRVEKRQFEVIDRVLNSMAVYTIIAWRIMYLCRLGRECPDLECDVVFEDSEWKAVHMAVTEKSPPEVAPSLNTMIRMIASLGGYVLRKTTEPGPQTLWTGLQRVQDLSLGWKTFGPDS